VTGQEAFNLIMARLNRTNATLRSQAVAEMQLLQRTKLEKGATLPDFLVLRDQSITLTAGDRRFSLPENFLRELNEDETLWIIDDANVYYPLNKLDYEDGLRKFPSTAVGSLPKDYFLEGKYGYVFPTPIIERTLRFSYYASDQLVSDTAIETLWLKHTPDLLIGATGAVIAALYVKDSEAALFFASLEQEAKKNYITGSWS
jgi:hypothetical protein